MSILRSPFPITSPARYMDRLRQELAFRATVAALILVFNEWSGIGAPAANTAMIRTAALIGLFLNGPYYLGAAAGRGLRVQAYGRALTDQFLVTVGLHAAGGLDAAAYLIVYSIVPVYAGIALSAPGCLVTTGVATVMFLMMAGLQTLGWLGTQPSVGGAWSVAAFNLLILHVVAVLTAILASAYRRSRRDLRQLHEELERAHDSALRLNAEIQRGGRLRLLGEVLAGVTHEMRNHLSGTYGQLGIARERARDASPGLLRSLDRARDGCEAAIRLMTTTLATAQKAADDRTTVSLADVAQQIVDLKKYDVRRDGMTIELDRGEEDAVVNAVPAQLRQIILNLVTNAQEAMQGSANPRVIRLAVRAELDASLLEVYDQGPGIPPGAEAQLFQPYYTTKPGGTGLGLAISAGIAREFGGTLTARNSVGGGAVFQLRLPRVGAPTVIAIEPPVGTTTNA